ncbi:thioredoxin family protein [Paenibacillus ginsengarvi]|uniref:Thioredoxin n=1 Tax=Paenibacillus ginsengarvi TaxID=400777 RepID=A0A3B0CGP2_9BACL|nr:thioredoxin family protein [Paenibacillus ginsengarvi]RKN84161.1 thioredoxin [Paenibacillus ginsengarvi]
MRERTEAELRRQTTNGDSFAVFLYTPLCGTCKVAARMLDIVQAMRPDCEPGQANVNGLPKLLLEWQIESVPCLVHIENGRIRRKLYAFESVENVLQFLEPIYLKSNRKDERSL